MALPAGPRLSGSPRKRLKDVLQQRVDGDVRFDTVARGAYSTDASNFRQIPIGVVLPRTPAAAVVNRTGLGGGSGYWISTRGWSVRWAS